MTKQKPKDKDWIKELEKAVVSGLPAFPSKKLRDELVSFHKVWDLMVRERVVQFIKKVRKDAVREADAKWWRALEKLRDEFPTKYSFMVKEISKRIQSGEFERDHSKRNT